MPGQQQPSLLGVGRSAIPGGAGRIVPSMGTYSLPTVAFPRERDQPGEEIIDVPALQQLEALPPLHPPIRRQKQGGKDMRELTSPQQRRWRYSLTNAPRDTFATSRRRIVSTFRRKSVWVPRWCGGTFTIVGKEWPRSAIATASRASPTPDVFWCQGSKRASRRGRASPLCALDQPESVSARAAKAMTTW